MKYLKAQRILSTLILLLIFLDSNTTSVFALDNLTKSTAGDSETSSESPVSPPKEKEEDENIKEVEKNMISPSNRKKPKKALSSDQIKKKKEVIEKVLKFGSNKERKDAMRELHQLPPEETPELLKIISETLINDNDNGIKIACLRTLAEAGAKSESKSILEALNYKSDDVREAALYSIQKLKLEDAKEPVNSLIKTQDFTKNSTITSLIINTIAELGSTKENIGFLEDKLKDRSTSNDVRGSIILLFGKLKESGVESVLIDLAVDDSEDVTIRSYAVNTLGKINSEKSVPKLRNQLEKINESKSKNDIKKYSGLKLYLISALIMLGDKEIVKDLISYAKDDDPNVRIRAIKQLAEIPDKNVMDLIEYKAQRDPSRKVQEYAKKVLEDLKKKGAPESAPEKTNEVKEKEPAISEEKGSSPAPTSPTVKNGN